jgi:hypothetical protein
LKRGLRACQSDCREPTALANEAGGRRGRPHPSAELSTIAATLRVTSSSPAVPPTCPKLRSAAVIHGQPRSVLMPSELQDRPLRSGPRAGLRRSVVMSDFIEGDPEGGEGSGGSRALWRRAAARLTAGAAEHADRQVAQARHDVGRCRFEPGKRPGEVTLRTQCREGVAVQTAYGLVQRVADH